MKTTLELPDALFIEAKATAARQRITLKKLITRALEKELLPFHTGLLGSIYDRRIRLARFKPRTGLRSCHHR